MNAILRSIEGIKMQMKIFRSSRFAWMIHGLKNKIVLEGTGKDMRHIKLKLVDSIDKELLKKWISAASE